MPITDLDAHDLIHFESTVAELFNSGSIRAPIHLSFGNESEILRIFADVRNEDWLFCSWRSHYQCLLKGVPEKLLLEEIIAGRSIALCFPEYRVYSSAIVGGTISIALGVAQGIKMSGDQEHVWCFLGDMTAEMGMAQSAIKFAQGHQLPITFVVEDNGVSVMTPTADIWGIQGSSWASTDSEMVRYYQYSSKYPHAGAGKRVEF